MKGNTIGERLKSARLEKQMTQKDVAGDFITRNMLSQIENGSAKPSIKTVEYLAKVLDKPIAYFMETLVDENLLTNSDYICIDDLIEDAEIGRYEECYDKLMPIINGIDSSSPPNNVNEIYLLKWKCDSEIGLNLFKEKKYKESEKYLQDALTCKSIFCEDTKKCMIYLALTKIYIELDNFQKAIKYFKSYELISKDLYIPFLNPVIIKGNLLLKSEDYNQCREFLENKDFYSLKNNFDYLFLLSICYCKLQKYDLALDYLFSILNLDNLSSDNTDITNSYIAECYSKKGNFEKAYEYMKKINKYM